MNRQHSNPHPTNTVHECPPLDKPVYLVAIDLLPHLEYCLILGAWLCSYLLTNLVPIAVHSQLLRAHSPRLDRYNGRSHSLDCVYSANAPDNKRLNAHLFVD